MLDLLDDVTDHVSDLGEGATAVAADAVGVVVDTVEHARAHKTALLRLLVVVLIAALAVVVVRRATADDTRQATT